MAALFVAGAGTEVGKTYVTAALVRALRARDLPVRALKPLASGVPEVGAAGFGTSDTGILLAAQGLPQTRETADACSPWRYRAPLSPDQAAALEARTLALADLVAWCHARMAEDAGPVLVEGVGGLMSPVCDEATGLDWLKALACPALLVTGTHLGAISHALTARETCAAHSVPVLGIVVSESAGAPAPPGVVAAAIARHADAPVVAIPRGAGCPEALAALVEHALTRPGAG